MAEFDDRSASFKGRSPSHFGMFQRPTRRDRRVSWETTSSIPLYASKTMADEPGTSLCACQKIGLPVATSFVLGRPVAPSFHLLVRTSLLPSWIPIRPYFYPCLGLILRPQAGQSCPENAPRVLAKGSAPAGWWGERIYFPFCNKRNVGSILATLNTRSEIKSRVSQIFCQPTFSPTT